MPSPLIGDLGEAELIARIRRHLPRPPDWMLVGIGDDAALVEPERNRVEAWSVDALIEGVHFDRAFVPARAIGHRALAVNLSDLAAMGAAPRAALLSLALPPALPLDDFDEAIAGLTALATSSRVHVAGGNLTRSPGPLMIDVTVIGTLKRRQALRRSGARPGDELYVSGTIGAAGAGLQMLRAGAARPAAEGAETGRGRGSGETPRLQSGSAPSAGELCVRRYLYPEPRVRLGLLLARSRAATACIDLSDGLADGVRQLAEASGVGIAVDAEALPIHRAARAWFETAGLDPAGAAMTAGDDYELLIAVSPRARGRLAAAERHGGVALTRIGRCTAERALVVCRAEGTSVVEAPLPDAGFRHFR